MPFDEFARELLTASGGTYEPLPSNFYSIMKKPEEMATFTSQVFLGVSLECARCHDHPSENWRRDDFMGLAAFFSQVKFKGGPRNNASSISIPTWSSSTPIPRSRSRRESWEGFRRPLIPERTVAPAWQNG
jgi:hypothetical protein